MEYYVEVNGFNWGLFFGLFVLGILFYIFYGWLLYRIGKKLNYPNSWYAWVPILNLWMMTELAGRDTTFFIILLLGTFLCGIVGLVMTVILWMDIAEKCGKDRVYGILTIIPIVNLFIMYVLGSGPRVPPQPPAAGYPGQYGPPPQGPPSQYPPPPPQYPPRQ
ncbi:MAG: DUF5684 domain-containing protein [Actinomycetota bacterium]|nr:DUF5684 domain-containing protein [Actinomycetota bacterium]MDD5666796.1 DUF5684 domain-containing protein [Actinomycetota bacterium]